MLLTTSLTAQQRAPGNESITQNDLRADLFFLAGDAMRGRLTDTNENRATADYIRARFERAGLKPVAGNSYFHTYNLMTATLGDGNSLSIPTSYGASNEIRSARELKSGQEFYPQRFSASATVTARVVFAGFGIFAPNSSHDDYKDAVRGTIVMVLDHEPGERDPKSPFEGVVTAEPAAAWRKALAAQDERRVGNPLCERCPQPSGSGKLRAGLAQLLAGGTGADTQLHARDVGRSRSAFPRANLYSAGGVADAINRPTLGTGEGAEDAGGMTGADRSRHHAEDRRRSPHRPRWRRAR